MHYPRPNQFLNFWDGAINFLIAHCIKNARSLKTARKITEDRQHKVHAKLRKQNNDIDKTNGICKAYAMRIYSFTLLQTSPVVLS